MGVPIKSKIDTVIVGVYDSSMVVDAPTKQIILIQDNKSEKEKSYFEHPLLVSFIYPILISFLGTLAIMYLKREKNKKEVEKLEQEIVSAQALLRSEASRLELAKKDYELKENEAGRNYEAKLAELNEERKKFDLEYLKYQHSQLNELKATFSSITTLIAKIENDFKLESGWEIEHADHMMHWYEYIVSNYKDILKEIRRIKAETLFLHSSLDSLFDDAINSIISLLNQINRDREADRFEDTDLYAARHIERCEAIQKSFNDIIEEIRNITKPYLALDSKDN